MEITVPFFNSRSLSRKVVAASTVALVMLAGLLVASPVSAEVEWGEAVAVEIDPSLHSEEPADEMRSISCPTTGECVAVGFFRKTTAPSASSEYVAFTVTMTGGAWGQAEPVAFADNVEHVNPNSGLESVSCAATGECVAVGFFKNTNGDSEAFTVTMTGGVWGIARPVTFDAADRTGTRPDFYSGVPRVYPADNLISVSCAAVGECVAGGRFVINLSNHAKAFTVTMEDGVWGNAVPVTYEVGQAALSPAPGDRVNSVSCAAVGECVAVGQVNDVPSSANEAFTMTMTNGAWNEAIVVDRTGLYSPDPLVTSPYNLLKSVSCVAIEALPTVECVAVGTTVDIDGNNSAFSTTISNGVPSPAELFDFTGLTVNDDPWSDVYDVSCSAPGECAAVGYFTVPVWNFAAFVVTMAGGTWDTVDQVVFEAGIENPTPNSYLNAVSCSSSGSCTAGGHFENADGYYEAFTVTQSEGEWAQGKPVTFGAGVQASTPDGRVESISCPSATSCVAVGWFENGANSYFYEGFVVSAEGATGGGAPAPSTPSVGSPTTTSPTVAPVKSVYDSAVPGVTVTDPTVYQSLPAEVSKLSALKVVKPTESKSLVIRSRSTSRCLVANENLVFLNEGLCIADVVNVKTGKVVRTLSTRVVSTTLSKLRVGNPIQLLSPLYFEKMSPNLDMKAMARIRQMKQVVSSAGTVLVIGHSGTLFGDTPANLMLSRSRAKATVKALKTVGASGPFVAQGVGPAFPVSTATSDSEQSKNHRVVIALIP